MSEQSFALTPEGNYIGTILGFGTPQDSKAKFGLQLLPIRIGIEGQTMVYYVAAYKSAMHMLVKSESLWIGKQVECIVRHQTFGENLDMVRAEVGVNMKVESHS